MIREAGGGCRDGERRSCAPRGEQRKERSRVSQEERSDCGIGKERLHAKQEREWTAEDKRVRAERCSTLNLEQQLSQQNLFRNCSSSEDKQVRARR